MGEQQESNKASFLTRSIPFLFCSCAHLRIWDFGTNTRYHSLVSPGLVREIRVLVETRIRVYAFSRRERENERTREREKERERAGSNKHQHHCAVCMASWKRNSMPQARGGGPPDKGNPWSELMPITSEAPNLGFPQGLQILKRLRGDKCFGCNATTGNFDIVHMGPRV